MIQRTIFKEKDILVTERLHKDIRGKEYWVERGDVGFSPMQCPELSYEALDALIADYLEERDQKLMADIENEDFEEDFGGFFDPDTEAY